jgi:hypothetical protein
MSRMIICLLSVIYAVSMPLSAADETADAFKSLYGLKIIEAKNSPSKDDDLALAADMLASAKESVDQPALLAMLCDNAYELSHKTRDGHGTAIDALGLLVAHVPTQKADALAKLIKLLERQYIIARDPEVKAVLGDLYLLRLIQMGDLKLDNEDASGAIIYYGKARTVATRMKSNQLEAIKQKQIAAMGLKATHHKIKLLRARLEANPKDTAASKQLIELYLTELDQPAKARKYTFLITDPVLKANVIMTGKPLEKLEAPEALTMARWYYGYSEKAKAHAKGPMLTRTKIYYERYLELHETADVQRKTAELALGKINRELEALGPAASVEVAAKSELVGKWLELLKLVDPKKHTESGKWVKQAGKIGVTEASFRPARIRIPVNPDGSYEIAAKFARTQGRGMVAIQLPVGKEGSFGIGLSIDNGAGVTIGEIDGEWENDTTNERAGFSNGRSHVLSVLVKITDDETQIKVAIDGKTVTTWKGDPEELGMNPIFRMPDPSTIGILSMGGNTLAFSSFKIKLADGELNQLTAEQSEQLAENRPEEDERRRFDPRNLTPEQREQLRRRLGGGRGRSRGRNNN